MKNFRNLMRENFEKKFSQLNLTSTQGMLVSILARDGEMKVSDLSKKMLLSNSTVSGIIDRLEKSNVVERRRNPKDRRKVMIDLTAEFREDTRGHFKAMGEHFASILKIATAEELDEILIGFKTLEKLLRRYNDNS